MTIRMRATLVAVLLLAAATPALAQIDLSGTWAQRPYTDSLGYNPGNGPTPVDYTGMPYNESGLARALGAVVRHPGLERRSPVRSLYGGVHAAGAAGRQDLGGERSSHR
jgi:hypothetical protein